MDTVREWELARRQEIRDGAVGFEHEFLDEPMRIVALEEPHADAAPFFGEIDERLGQVEVE